MAIDDPRSDAAPGAFVGFQTYADGTPRAFDAAVDAGPPAAAWVDDPARREPAMSQRRGARTIVAVSVAVLAAFGGGYLLARSDPPSPPARPVSEAAAMAAARPMNVQVAEVAPPPLTTNGAKLEVLPRESGPVVAREPAPRPLAAMAPPPPRIQAEAPPTRDAAEITPTPLTSSVQVAPSVARASYDCADAPSPARAMVCRDGGLARMDQRMKQAYAAALAAGAPQDDLAADQEDWLAVREEAARYSRRAVADIYRQRIDELDAMRERPWR